jgi:hypothetical protein
MAFAGIAKNNLGSYEQAVAWFRRAIEATFGISRARAMAVELAWRWVYWQPDSQLTRWFKVVQGAGPRRGLTECCGGNHGKSISTHARSSAPLSY